MIRILILLISNLILGLSSLPSWIVFCTNYRKVKQIQIRLLHRIITKNLHTSYGQKYGFNRNMTLQDFQALPLTGYENYDPYIELIKKGEQDVLTTAPVILLEPTSGSITGSKLIPYTNDLQKEFQVALEVWIINLFICYPKLLFGKHYWLTTPSITKANHSASAVKIGFDHDTSYLGKLKQFISKYILVVPLEINKVQDIKSYEYLTLLYLVQEKHLRFVSVWCPTYFTMLLEKLSEFWVDLIIDIEHGTISTGLIIDKPIRDFFESKHKANPIRARELAQLEVCQPDKIWPELKLISCWKDGHSRILANRLIQIFPNARIEGKGLLATEGVVSIPIGKLAQKALAYQSHFFEFKNSITGKICFSWELEIGQRYSVIITTGGGFYRYQLFDMIEISGYFGGVPCFSFIAKDNLTSDLVGEKIYEIHAEAILSDLSSNFKGLFRFAMLAPVNENNLMAYVLFFELDKPQTYSFTNILQFLESSLSANYHYLQARNLDQLSMARLFIIEANTAEKVFFTYHQSQGKKLGDIKRYALSKELGWDKRFVGKYWINE